MLNYLSAELYKLRFHAGLYLGTALLLLLEFLVFLPGIMIREVGRDYIPWDVLLGFMVSAMMVGIFIAPIFAAMVFDNQYGNGTMKNEIVFGMPRSRIYLGKMLAGAIAGTLVALLSVGFFLGLTFLLGGPPTAAGEYLVEFYLEGILTQWLIWLGVYAFSFWVLYLLHSSIGAILVTYMTILFSPMFVAILMEGNNIALPWKLAGELSFMAPLVQMWLGGNIHNLVLEFLGGNSLVYAGVICLLWWLLSIGTGWLILSRREIK